MLAALGKAYKSGGLGGVLKVALDAVIANSPILKMVAFMVDFLRKLWANSAVLNKLISAGMAIWQKMADFFSWLLDSIKGGLQWIRDGLGVTRSEKKAEFEKKAKDAGVWYSESDKSWMNKGGTRISDSAVPDAVKRSKEAYDTAPKGFFEGIPGIADLTAALQANTLALTKKVQETAAKAASVVEARAQPILANDIKTVNQKIASGAPVSRLSTDLGNPSGLIKFVLGAAFRAWMLVDPS